MFKIYHSKQTITTVPTIKEAQNLCDTNYGYFYRKAGKMTISEKKDHVKWLVTNYWLSHHGLNTQIFKLGYQRTITKKVTKRFLNIIPYTSSEVKDVPWYECYTLTEEQLAEVRKFFIETIIKVYKKSYEEAEKEYLNLNSYLQYN